MSNHLIRRLYEAITGRPWTTTRSMAEEYGPPPAVAYPELAGYSDAELIRRDIREVIAEIEAARAAVAAAEQITTEVQEVAR